MKSPASSQEMIDIFLYDCPVCQALTSVDIGSLICNVGAGGGAPAGAAAAGAPAAGGDAPGNWTPKLLNSLPLYMCLF